jgi:hypothetical protein
MRSVARVQVRQRNRRSELNLGLVLGVLAIVFLLGAVEARSQNTFPRLGLSASPDVYIDTIEVAVGEEFTLYACVFGYEPGQALAQPVSRLSWVIHQVCCGAQVDIIDVQYNPEFTHEGHPILGVYSTVPACYDQPAINLATLTCVLAQPIPAGVLWAAGPYDASSDCDGGNALFMGMPVSILPDEITTPTEETAWGTLKALYR